MNQGKVSDKGSSGLDSGRDLSTPYSHRDVLVRVKGLHKYKPEREILRKGLKESVVVDEGDDLKVCTGKDRKDGTQDQ